VVSVVLVGALLIVSECVVVVVVAGAGFSTTVVHEVRRTAVTASSGVRIISFFIVEVVPSRTNRRRFLGQMYFELKFSGSLRSICASN
jgi:hypothetical protein